MRSFAVLLYHELIGPRGRSGRNGNSVVVANGYRDCLPPALELPADEFARQMAWLADTGWHALDLDEVRSFYGLNPGPAPRGTPSARQVPSAAGPAPKPGAASGGPVGAPGLPEQSVLICFDDLYQSLADLSAPILRRHGLRAVGFACRDWIFDRPQARERDRPVCLSWPELAGLGDVLDLANHSASLHSRHAGRTAIEDLAAAEAARPGDPAGGRAAFLADTLAGEAATGRRAVYAWPFGAAPEPARRWLGEAGIQLAFGTQPGWNDAGSDRLNLKRTLVPPGLDQAGFAAICGSRR
jgi:peptidoglycan/xylan/chitin deacetylase (PgdA/CDA1 family)